MDLPGIEKAEKLDLHAGDVVVVHMDRDPTAQEAYEIAARLPHAIGVDVRVVVVPPGMDLEAEMPASPRPRRRRIF